VASWYANIYLSYVTGKCRAHATKSKYCKYHECLIVQVAVHHPLEEPQILRDGVAILPGHEVFIKVTGEVTIADPGLKALPRVSYEIIHELM